MKIKNNIESIYNSNIDDLYGYGIKLGFDCDVVMDAIHDVFYRICNSQYPLSKIENVRAYLFNALRNTLFNSVRANKKFVSIDEFPMQQDYYFNIKVSVEDPLINHEEKEKICRIINSMLNSLSDREREIVYLRYIKECDYEEISSKMDIDINSCYKLMHKAISFLKKQFSDYSLATGNITKSLLIILASICH